MSKPLQPATPTFGRRIRQARKALGLPQSALGIPTTVSVHECGVNRISVETGAHYARVLGVSLAWIIEGDATAQDMAGDAPGVRILRALPSWSSKPTENELRALNSICYQGRRLATIDQAVSALNALRLVLGVS